MEGRRPFLSAFLLWTQFCGVAAMTEPQICYLLDGILFLYGIILTVLYFRIRNTCSKAPSPPRKSKKTAEEGIYTGLARPTLDTYETVGVKRDSKK